MTFVAIFFSLAQHIYIYIYISLFRSVLLSYITWITYPHQHEMSGLHSGTLRALDLPGKYVVSESLR